MRGQPLEPVLGAVFDKLCLGHLQPGVDVVLTRGRGGETRVVVPFGCTERGEQRLPFLVGLHRDADIARGRFVDQIDEAGGLRLVELVADEGLAVHVRMPEKIDHRVEHGDMHMLTGRAVGARQQGRGDGLGGDIAGELVRHDGTHQARARCIRAPLDARQARQRLHKRVVDRIGRIGAGGPETADRAVDDVRRHGPNGVFAKAHALDYARTEILNEHVGVFAQPQQRLVAGRRLEVERDRALVAVVVQITRREAVALVRREPGVVAHIGTLDLEYFRALVGELHGRERARNHGRKVDDAIAGQRLFHAREFNASRKGRESGTLFSVRPRGDNSRPGSPAHHQGST